MRVIEPLLAATVLAAPGWSQERLVSALGDRQASYDAIVAGAHGGGLVGATLGECSIGLAGMAAAAPPPVATLQEELWSGPVASGDGYVAVLNRLRCGGTSMELADLAGDGRVVRRTALPVDGYAEPVEIRPGGDGSLAVAWAERPSERRVRLRAVIRRADGRLGPRVTLVSRRVRGALDPGVDELAVATGVDGRVLVAWTTARQVWAATISRSGRPGRPVVVGRSLGVAAPAVALGSGGRGLVAWSTHDGGEEQNERTRVYAAVRDGRRFRPARLLERAPAIDDRIDPTDPRDAPTVAVAPDGHALMAWASPARRGYRVRVAGARPTRGFGARRTLASDGAHGDVGFDRSGRPLVSWTSRGRIYVERGGIREQLASADEPTAPRLSVLADGRVRATWITGLADYDPHLHLATQIVFS